MAAIALTAAATALTSSAAFAGALGTAGIAAGSFGASIAGSLVTGLAGMAGGMFDSAFLGPSRDTQGPRLSSLSPPTATEGTFRREVIGTMRVPGELIWSLTKEEVEKTQKGGKGGGGTATTFSYFGTFAHAFCGGIAETPTTVYVNSERRAWDDLPATFYGGEASQMPDPIIVAAQGEAPAYRGTAYAVFDRLPLDDFGGAFPLIEVAVTVPTDPGGLRGTVARLASNRGLVVDTSEVDEYPDLTGYFIENAMSFRSAIEPLSALFDLDVIEEAGRIRVVSRRHVPVAELQMAALVAREGAPVTWRRGAVTDVPRSTVMKHSLADRDFSIRTTPHILRSDATGEREKTIDFPGALSAEAAAMLHRRAVGRAEDGRERLDYTMRLADLEYMQGDILTLPSSATRRHDALITRQTIGSSIRCEAAVISARPDLAQGSAPQAIAQRFDAALPATVALFMDLPALTDAERDAHAPWVAMDADRWRGGIVWRDEGQGFEPILSVSSRAAIGVLTSALAAGVTDARDDANTVTVRMRRDHAFEGLPYADLDGTTRNALAIRNAVGDWEVLQFATATLTGPNLWTLGGLRRGLRGTEFTMGADAGAAVVVLDEAIEKLPLDREQLDRAYPYRHGPVGVDNADARVKTVVQTFGGKGLRPRAPSSIDAEYEPGNPAVISWTPRRRLETDPSTLPERHRVRVYDGAVVLREWIVDMPTAEQAYPEGQMIADHGGMTAPPALDIGVQPVTDEFGAGAELRVLVSL